MESRGAATCLIILVSAIMASATTDQEVNRQHSDTNIVEFIKSSCKVTRYTQLCVSSLSPYAGSLEPGLSDLVKAAMNVSLLNARNACVWAANMEKTSAIMSEKGGAALHDCIQNFEDAVDEIKKSLREMEQLRSNTFHSQVNDMQTFMSAASTDQDSCLGGFEDVKAQGRIHAMVRVVVQNESELISNALALLNAFAATGGGRDNSAIHA